MPKAKVQTGVRLGFKKGDFVFTGAFPAIIMSDVRTFAPCCEVWGVEHEGGSVLATDLKKITKEQFLDMAQRQGHTLPLAPFSKEGKEALKDA